MLTTYRLTEHHTAGGASMIVPYLAELQPEFFVEVSAGFAAERGLKHTRPMHLVGAPYHGGVGIVTSDSPKELLRVVLDNDVHINEYKVATCGIRPGRHPRGQARLRLVEEYRPRAEESRRRRAEPAYCHG